MVFKLGPRGLGYYRDVPKTAISLMQLLPAVADASPIVLQLDQVISEQMFDLKLRPMLEAICEYDDV